jgi:hypothetical protein
MISIVDYKTANLGSLVIIFKRLGLKTQVLPQGGEHYESTFNKFYQAHILPAKFGVNKRRIPLSAPIINREIRRDEAVRELEQPRYDPNQLEQERGYVCKKLRFSEAEFATYLSTPPASHFDYLSYARLSKRLVAIHMRMRYV